MVLIVWYRPMPTLIPVLLAMGRRKIQIEDSLKKSFVHVMTKEWTAKRS